MLTTRPMRVNLSDSFSYPHPFEMFERCANDALLPVNWVRPGGSAARMLDAGEKGNLTGISEV